MNKETFDQALAFADKLDDVADQVHQVAETASVALDRTDKWLRVWAENIRREATKQRAEDVWPSATDDVRSTPTADSTQDSSTQNSPDMEAKITEVLERLSKVYRDRQRANGSTEEEIARRISNALDNLFKKP